MRLRTLGAVTILVAALPLAAQVPAGAPADTGRPRHAATVFQPVEDQARGVDAELRMALFDLVENRPLTALNRLEWLAQSMPLATSGPAARSGMSGGAGSVRAAEDLRFLLAESYYRLGLGESFRVSALELLSVAPAGRYAPLLQMQLMLDAYRRGDYAGARAKAAKLSGAPDAALADFVAGLAAYQVGDYKSARASFATVIAAGNAAFAPYARYMDALAAMQGDSTRAPAALEALRPIVAAASGPLADQLRIAAAQLAFRGGSYDAAAQFAAEVPATSGLAPDAVLARAWSLYRAGHADTAGPLFADYATRWPQLPARDEARLMHGQILLEQQHASDAEAYFTQVGDSLGAELASLQARMNAAMAQAARALVAGRAAGALFVHEAGTGKSLALAPDAGAEGPVMVAAYAGAPVFAEGDSAGPSPVTFADVQARFDAVTPALPADVTRRPFYQPASSTVAYADFFARDQVLLAADLSAALARYRLLQALNDHAMRVSTLHNLQLLIIEGTTNLGDVNKQIVFAQDSLTKMTALIAVARQVLHDALGVQTATTTQLAKQNIASLDSLRASLGSNASPADADIMTTEIGTAATYGRVAAAVEHGLDSAISRHPVFVLRDSLDVRVVRARALSVQGRQLLGVNTALVTAELARLDATESERTRAARDAVAAAEKRKAAAEGQLVSIVEAELRARAAALVAMLARSQEAAEYGSASAAFFVAIGAQGAAATTAASAAATPATDH